MKIWLYLMLVVITCAARIQSNELPHDQEIFGNYFFNPNTPATPMATHTPYTPVTPYEFTARTSNSYSTDEEEIDEWLQPMFLDCNDIINTDYDNQLGELNIFTQSLEENQKKLEAILAFRKKHMDRTCCGKLYSNLSSLAAHYDVTHTKDGKHICAFPQCNYLPKQSFGSAFSHYIKHHNPSFLSCPVPTCAKDFSGLNKLKNHFNRCSLGILYQQKKDQLSPVVPQTTSEFQQLPRKLQTAINNINYSRVADEHKKLMQGRTQNSTNQPVSSGAVKQPTAPKSHSVRNSQQSKLPSKLRTVIKAINTSHGISSNQPTQANAHNTIDLTNDTVMVSQPNRQSIPRQESLLITPVQLTNVQPANTVTVPDAVTIQHTNNTFIAPVSKTTTNRTHSKQKKVIPSKKIDNLPLITKQPNEELRAALLARIGKK